MEIIGVVLLTIMLIIFGISALANAYEASQRHNQDKEE